MTQTTFDLAVLRSFVAGVDLGSFAKAADVSGARRPPSARRSTKLEEQAGTPLFRIGARARAHRAGEVMLNYARRLRRVERRSGGRGARRRSGRLDTARLAGRFRRSRAAGRARPLRAGASESAYRGAGRAQYRAA